MYKLEMKYGFVKTPYSFSNMSKKYIKANENLYDSATLVSPWLSRFDK